MSKSGIKLYLIHFDGEGDYIEAQNFSEAVDIWKSGMKREQGEDWEEEEPESVALIHEKAVWR